VTNNQDELITRLTRFYRETGSEVSATPPAWVVPVKRRAAGWLQPALATIVLVALAVGLAVTIRLVREEAHRKSVPLPIPSASPSPSPSTSATPLPSWILRRVPIGSVVAMSLDSSAVFVLYDPGPINGRPDPARTMLARIDRGTAAVTTAGPFTNATLLARVAPGLWIGAGADQATAASDTQWLTLVDPVTLSVKHRVHLPGKPASGTFSLPQIAATSDLLWLSYGDSLYRLDPATGRILLTQGLQATATSLSIDSAGRRLYVGVDAPPGPNSQALVIESDSMTGGRSPQRQPEERAWAARKWRRLQTVSGSPMPPACWAQSSTEARRGWHYSRPRNTHTRMGSTYLFSDERYGLWIAWRYRSRAATL
jgi:hypothetical protein